MNQFYALRRANGDWFALDDNGRLRVPLFESSRDATTARMRNSGMQLFKPVALDARLLKNIVPATDEPGVDFWLVKDPTVSLNGGQLIEHAQLAVLMKTPEGSGVIR